MSPYGRRAIEAWLPAMGAFGGLGKTWQYKQAWRRRLRGPHLRCLPEDEPGVGFGLTDPAIPDQCGEHSLDLRQNATALSEVGGDVVAGQRAGRSDQGGHDGGGLSEVAGREYRLGAGGHGLGSGAHRAATEVELRLVSGGAEFGDLIVGAEPAHEALGDLLRALLVQGDETGEDLGLRQVGRPAICCGDGCIGDCRRGTRKRDARNESSIEMLGTRLRGWVTRKNRPA
jgi:hypothetical protein